jgi:hypothetical protein
VIPRFAVHLDQFSGQPSIHLMMAWQSKQLCAWSLDVATDRSPCDAFFTAYFLRHGIATVRLQGAAARPIIQRR